MIASGSGEYQAASDHLHIIRLDTANLSLSRSWRLPLYITRWTACVFHGVVLLQLSHIMRQKEIES